MTEMIDIAVPERLPERLLVTGGAGFIGSHLSEVLARAGRRVTIYDNMSSGNAEWLEWATQALPIEAIIADLEDAQALRQAVSGQDMVWHLAGNADIPRGAEDTELDLNSAVHGTRNLLEAMVAEGVQELVFSSTGAVYGNLARERVSEAAGPLLPLSLYAAGKLAAESFISAYCSLFGLRSWIFRFGNVLGARMPRGAIRDFARKLVADATELEILGDGHQRKNYFLVEDCLDGMFFACDNVRLTADEACITLNLGADSWTGITEIARQVAIALGIPDVPFRFTGGSTAWPGDQPVVRLDASRMHTLGWRASRSSNEAVAIAVRRMLAHLGLAATDLSKAEGYRPTGEVSL